MSIEFDDELTEQELAEQTAAGLKDDQGQDNLKGA